MVKVCHRMPSLPMFVMMWRPGIVAAVVEIVSVDVTAMFGGTRTAPGEKVTTRSGGATNAVSVTVPV